MLAGAKRRSSRILTIYYLIGLLLVAGVSGGFYAVFAQHDHRDTALAALINTSGRQRMLCQRVAGLAAEYRLGDQTAQAPLLAAAAELEARQNMLLTANLRDPGRDADTLRIRQIYLGGNHPLATALHEYLAAARRVAALPPGAPAADAALAILFAQVRAPLLTPLNEVVLLQQHRAEQALNHLDGLEVASLLVILLTLAAEAMFIFRPMIRATAGYTAELKSLIATASDAIMSKSLDGIVTR
jgi:hypothetical protein